MPANPEAEPSAPRDAEEMRLPDPEFVQHGDDVRDAKGHRIRIGVVWLVAPPMTPMVDEDEPELIGGCGERLRDRGSADQLDGSNPPRIRTGAPPSVILEGDLGRVPGVRRGRHRRSLSLVYGLHETGYTASPWNMLTSESSERIVEERRGDRVSGRMLASCCGVASRSLVNAIHCPSGDQTGWIQTFPSGEAADIRSVCVHHVDILGEVALAVANTIRAPSGDHEGSCPPPRRR